ncbi:hypothetical protein MNBD_CPR01-181 [hydrothermal vent metagenome]|uniref:Uncharacterized protein n=1 Tax=hydrothermal vent metagenome TaxID=652676 RepID=A0A3B0UP72_9ZZZZ
MAQAQEGLIFDFNGNSLEVEDEKILIEGVPSRDATVSEWAGALLSRSSEEDFEELMKGLRKRNLIFSFLELISYEYEIVELFIRSDDDPSYRIVCFTDIGPLIWVACFEKVFPEGFAINESISFNAVNVSFLVACKKNALLKTDRLLIKR